MKGGRTSSRSAFRRSEFAAYGSPAAPSGTRRCMHPAEAGVRASAPLKASRKSARRFGRPRDCGKHPGAPGVRPTRDTAGRTHLTTPSPRSRSTCGRALSEIARANTSASESRRGI